MGNAYASAKDLKRLEKKVDSMLEAHKLDSKLTDKERRLVREVKRDIKSNKKSFTSIKNL